MQQLWGVFALLSEICLGLLCDEAAEFEIRPRYAPRLSGEQSRIVDLDSLLHSGRMLRLSPSKRLGGISVYVMLRQSYSPTM